jgi:uncharacterized protein
MAKRRHTEVQITRADAAAKPEAPTPPKDCSIIRFDGWQDLVGGMGVQGYDKRLNVTPQARTLTPEAADIYWRSDWTCKRVIEKPGEELFRKGFEVTIEADEEAAPADVAADDDPVTDIGEEGSDDNEATEDTTKPEGEEPAEPPVEDEEREDAFPPFGKAAGPAIPEKPEAPPPPIEGPDQKAQEATAALRVRLEELQVAAKFRKAFDYKRGFGGGAIFVAADDGQTVDQELKPEQIKTIRTLTVLSRKELTPVEWYLDPMDPKFGEPKIYQISPVSAGGATGSEIKGAVPTATKTAPQPKSTGGTPSAPGSSLVRVHESRLIVFQGWYTTREHLAQNGGWGESCLVHLLDVFAEYALVWGASAQLTAEFAQNVIKIKKLYEAIAQGDKQAMLDRLQIMQASMSTFRAIAVDAEGEEFERKSTPITGLPELIDRFCTRLAAAAEIPVTILFGEAPAGLNATGDSDIRNFYDRIASMQETELRPALERMIRYILLSKDGPTSGKEPDDWKLTFHPLWQLTDAEDADMRYVVAQTDALYIDKQVCTPAEVAASRFGGAKYSRELTIDFEGREELAAQHEQDMAAHEEEQQKALKAAEKGQPAEGAMPGKPLKPGKPGANPFAK